MRRQEPPAGDFTPPGAGDTQGRSNRSRFIILSQAAHEVTPMVRPCQPGMPPGSAFRSAAVVRFVTIISSQCTGSAPVQCTPIPRTNRGQMIKKA